jgi:tRNA pseudouridine38-40 synthase
VPQPPQLTVGGRTDAGVHARGQVCHADLSLSAWRALPGRSSRSSGDAAVHRLAGVLPIDVRVFAAEEAPRGFDARFSAVARCYAYRVADTPYGVDPLRRHDVLWHPRRLDLDAMNAAASQLLGQHDFAAFCKPRAGTTTVRTLLALRCARAEQDFVGVHVEADAFCHAMVRSLVGALLAVGDGRRPIDWPRRVLAEHRRDPAVPVVAPHGLTLEEIRYPPDHLLAARADQARAVRGASLS